MKKILVANRGEIALRVIKTARKMGIITVAIYSDPDRFARHAKEADEAYYVGPGPSTESYLNLEKIIDIALKNEVDGIHPGYGFLSENALFAEKVKEAGLTFIGPSPESIRIMGSKLAAKDAVKKYNIPMVPGTDTAIKDIENAKKLAAAVGFPILIKASAGGGGKGMRIVETEEQFESQMRRAISEAENAFGDGAVFIEKYVTSPRHIEIQILADNFGNVIHLHERECSIQRRHQKVVEEAPSSLLTPELRHKMGEDAIKVAQSCQYSGAGTVEFLMDADLNYYFLEMNTRLQVEHPVTEMITGIDLVEQQIKIARNEPLKLEQDKIPINGHAVELRVYAEDSSNNFMPDIGTLDIYNIPQIPGVRVDDGYQEGDEIPIYYDPMIAKLVAWDTDRSKAIQKLKWAIENYIVEGVETTLDFGHFVCSHPAFISGDFDTHFVSKYFDGKYENDETMEALAVGAVLHYLKEKEKVKKIKHPEQAWAKR